MTVIENGSVLVAVSEYGEFSSLLPLCREVESELGLHPVFVFAPGYGLAREHGQLVELEKWSWTQLGSELSSFRTELDERSMDGYFRVFSGLSLIDSSRSSVSLPDVKFRMFYWVLSSYRLLSIIGRGLLRKGWNAGHRAKGMLLLLKGISQAENIFQTVRPRLILSGQDYALSVTSILSRLGEQYGIKTAIVPFNMPPTTREIIASFAYANHNHVNGWLEKWLAKKVNPKWLTVYRGKVYSRENLMAALIVDRLGMTPAEPWLPNSGRGVVFVPSQWGYDYYLKSGIPDSQLRLTGAAWSDALVQAKEGVAERRTRLLSTVHHNKVKRASHDAPQRDGHEGKLVILSWPPNQYPRKALGCATYNDLCQQFIQTINEIHSAGFARVAVSLHPTLTDPKLLKKLRKAGIYVIRGGLIEVVDCADLFISTVSSTAFWALQCGIPTINYDGYLYGYIEFEEAGAITVRTPAELFTTCKLLFDDPQQYEEVRAGVVERSRHFTEATGMNMQRILSSLAELVEPVEKDEPVNLSSQNSVDTRS